ncbi:MAG: NUDIX domain-containing protein [Bacteroidota bacterium]|nr:NUDIX domain-containing protein [Bacteroidota bacterium]
MPPIRDKSIGVILYFKFPRSLKFLILKHKKGHWSFAKGHREEDETAIETAKRELHEEAGIDNVEFLSKRILIEENYIFLNKNNDKVSKSVDYFIAKSLTKKVKIDNKEIINYKWCTLSAAEKVITFKESRKTLRKANTIIIKEIN